jgi:hypothetical protein
MYSILQHDHKWVGDDDSFGLLCWYRVHFFKQFLNISNIATHSVNILLIMVNT